jgi:hypothetical protein
MTARPVPASDANHFDRHLALRAGASDGLDAGQLANAIEHVGMRAPPRVEPEQRRAPAGAGAARTSRGKKRLRDWFRAAAASSLSRRR